MKRFTAMSVAEDKYGKYYRAEDIDPKLDSYHKALTAIQTCHEDKAALIEVLKELTQLMDEVIEHTYIPDSFTTQPAKVLLRRLNCKPETPQL